ncbi:hypothetical protein A374_06271 [Fictibacillus macauensis ZFHKF-1]|uniref:DUF4003 domain-containing protein n=1 Tax=Fictibacillus macauensis ZFHKF-1 TaxID=1196324 RepID=I8AK35_9BACL|nr:DUF4003 family protein [Fictibacillus macauensis]EIT86182.1 hypothetical protein A374_06271 [Fictibacillus macauensis ZFHKF-1]
MGGSGFYQKLSSYSETFQQVREAHRWSSLPKQSMMMIAALYTIHQKPFQKDQFNDLTLYIKEHAGRFSPLKSVYRYSMAAIMDVQFDYPEEAFQQLVSLYNRLVAARFKRGIFTYMAAEIMLSHAQEVLDEDIARTMAIYRGMAKHHAFLTSESDYPLAALLAGRNESVELLLEKMEIFYSALVKGSFTRGNDLQFLSHILSLGNSDEQLLIERAESVYRTFKNEGQRPKGMFYPIIGMLALLKDGEQAVKTILQGAQEMGYSKHFRWSKDINIMMSAQLYLSDHMDDASFLKTGLVASIEAIMQAQQAAVMAAVAVSVSTSSTSSY